MENGIYLLKRADALVLVHLQDQDVVCIIVDRGEAVAGTLYAGRIERSEPHQYWVNIGLEKPALLQRAKGSYTQGQRVLVQLRRPPLQEGNLVKNAEVSDAPSFMGRALSYMPGKQGINFSAQLKDKDWKQGIQQALETALQPSEGLFIRGRAYGKEISFLKEELKTLRSLWECVQGQGAEKPKEGTILYAPERPFLAYCLDQRKPSFFTQNADCVVTLKAAGVEPQRLQFSPVAPWLDQINHSLACVVDPVVPLMEGGYLVIEEGQTLTAIDVNTTSPGESRLTRGAVIQGEGDRLTFAQNALNEAIRQIYLRKIGGIILIDLPRLSNPKHHKALEKAAKEYEDTNLQVLGFTKSGLLEMTKRKDEPSLKTVLGGVKGV